MKQYVKSLLWALAGIVISLPMLKSEFALFFDILLVLSTLLLVLAGYQFLKR